MGIESISVLNFVYSRDFKWIAGDLAHLLQEIYVQRDLKPFLLGHLMYRSHLR